MKFTEEHKRKISEALKGHIPSLETCKKISMANKGKTGRSGKLNPMFGKLGINNPNYGSKRSEETKLKIALTSRGRWLGRHHKEESKLKCQASHKRLVKLGIHPSWRGGKTSKLMVIRTSKEYRDWRKAVFERDNYTCQDCGIRSGKGQKAVLNADHIKSFAIYPEFRFEISNGRTLCLDCHKKTDTFGPKSRNPETHLLSIKRYWASL